MKKYISILLVMCMLVTGPVTPGFANEEAADAVPDAEVVLEKNPQTVNVTSVCMGTNRTITTNDEGGRTGWLLNSGGTASSQVLIDLSDDFVKNVSNGSEFRVEIDYLDLNNGCFVLGYDSQDLANRETDLTYVDNTGEWKTAVYILDDAYFGNRLSGAYDLKVDVRGDKIRTSRGSVTIGAVRVYRTGIKYGVQTTAIMSEQVGNIFGNGEAITFTVDFENRVGTEQDTEITFYVKDVGNEIVWSKKEKLTIPGKGLKGYKLEGVAVDKYGLYRIYSQAKGDTYTHTFSRPFSFVNNRTDGRKNKKLGFATHWDRWDNDRIDDEAKVIAKSGAGLVRGNPTRWSEVDAGGKKFNYKMTEKGDHILSTIAEYDFDYFPILGLYPAAKYGLSGSTAIPITDEQLEGYAGYVKFMTERFKEYGINITVYELWNEIDIRSFNSNGDSTQAAKVGEVGAKAVKEVDPDAFVGLSICQPVTNKPQITFGSGLSTEEYSTWEAMLTTGFGEYADSLTVHSYDPNKKTEEGGQIDFVKDWKGAFRAATGKDVEGVFNSEYGRSGAAQVSKDFRSVARYAARDLIYYFGLGTFDAMAWYVFNRMGNIGDYNEDTYGAVERGEVNLTDTPLSANESFLVITNYNTLMTGAGLAKPLLNAEGENERYAYYFERENGQKPIMALWTTDATDMISFTSSAEEVTLYDMYGNAEKVQGKDGVFSFVVTGEPQYVEGDISDAEICDDPIEFKPYSDKIAKSSIVGIGVNKAPSDLTIEVEEGLGVEYVSGAGPLDINTKVRVKLPDSTSTDVIVNLPDQDEGLVTEIKLRVKDGDKTAFVYRLPVRVTESVSSGITAVPVSVMDTSHWVLKAEVENMREGVPITGELELAAPTAWNKKIKFDTIPELSTAEINIETGLLTTLDSKMIEWIIRTDKGDEHRFSKFIDFSVAAFRNKENAPRIDGVLSDGEWYMNTAMVSDKKEQYSKLVSDWMGKDDCSAKIMMQCDEENLYLGVDVTDDDYNISDVGSNIWKNDSVQFGIGFDIVDAQVFYGGNFTEIAISDTTEGPTVWRHVSEGNLKDLGAVEAAKLAVRREGNHTFYELSIPWDEITEKDTSADKLRKIGFSILVNDNDAGVRKGAMTYGGGIIGAKDIGQFKFLTVLKED